MNKKILLCIAGLSGAIGTTISVGLSIAESEESVKTGMVTESKLLTELEISFLPLNSILIDGWDLKTENLYESVLNQGICSVAHIEKAKCKLQHIVPRLTYNPIQESIGDWIYRESIYIRKKCFSENIEQVFIVNLCPTEPCSIQLDDDDIDWDDLNSMQFDSPGVTMSRLFFRLAIEVGAHYINYTPNIAETDKLQKMAKEKCILHCGRDGKTGQTFIKTLIAPAFRDKNFRIDGWFSTNILGNNDGVTLSDSDCKLTKRKSKSECLPSILGYTPGGEDSEFGHQVHIHYYPPRGDAKEAWDNIDFTGFLGSRMQMKINWLGWDSFLAAPSIIDLVRIVYFAAQNGNKGLLNDVSFFFKSPLSANGNPVKHSIPDQFLLLIDFLKGQSSDRSRI